MLWHIDHVQLFGFTLLWLVPVIHLLCAFDALAIQCTFQFRGDEVFERSISLSFSSFPLWLEWFCVGNKEILCYNHNGMEGMMKKKSTVIQAAWSMKTLLKNRVYINLLSSSLLLSRSRSLHFKWFISIILLSFLTSFRLHIVSGWSEIATLWHTLYTFKLFFSEEIFWFAECNLSDVYSTLLVSILVQMHMRE